MNKDKARYIASVMIAWADGKTLQFKTSSFDWIRFTGTTPNFTGEGLEWRVDPEPFECWVIIDAFGHVEITLFLEPGPATTDHYNAMKCTIHHMREVL